MGSASCTNCFSFSFRGQTYFRKHSICTHLFKAGMNAVASHHGWAEFSCCRYVFVIGGGFSESATQKGGLLWRRGTFKKQDPSHPSHLQLFTPARASFNVHRVGSVFSTFIVIQLLRNCPLIYMDPPPV